MSVLESITHIVNKANELEITPTEALKRIGMVLEVVAREPEQPLEGELVSSPNPMSYRAWTALVVIVFMAGLVTGWSLRVSATKDRYLVSLAEQHEAAAKYYNDRTDQMVRDNERKYGNGKNKN